MKKVLTLTLFAAILFVACEKENVQTASQKLTHNRVITLPSEGKTGNSTIMLVSIGHKSGGIDESNMNICECNKRSSSVMNIIFRPIP